MPCDLTHLHLLLHRSLHVSVRRENKVEELGCNALVEYAIEAMHRVP